MYQPNFYGQNSQPTPNFSLPPTPPQPPQYIDSVQEPQKLVQVDLACGDRKRQDCIGVDIVKIPGVDIVHDLEHFPWPFADNSIDKVYCIHYLEHVTDLIKFMEELYRIMVPKGKAEIQCPYYNTIRAWQDPTHKQVISEASFLYYNSEWRKREKLEHYPIKCDFDFEFAYVWSPEWQLRSEEAKTFAAKYYTNVINDVILNVYKR